MAILCPSCAARQAISEETVGYGRMLHCDWCGTRWIARPYTENPFRRIAFKAEPEDISDAVVIEHIAPGRGQHPGPRQRRVPPPFPVDRVWLKRAGIALAVLTVLFALRVPLVAATLPQKGLAAETEQLAFQRVHSATMIRNGVKTLVVEGELVNTSAADAVVPAIRVSLRSPTGAEVYSWTVEPTEAGLAPGASFGFRSAISAPPAEARQVTLRLAERENQIVGMR